MEFLVYAILCSMFGKPSVWHQADCTGTIVYNFSSVPWPSDTSLLAQIPYLPDTALQTFDHNDKHSNIWRLRLHLIDNPLEPSSSSNSSIISEDGNPILSKSCHRGTSQQNVPYKINWIYVWALSSMNEFVLATVIIWMFISYQVSKENWWAIVNTVMNFRFPKYC
jgi:hypothetical protein